MKLTSIVDGGKKFFKKNSSKIMIYSGVVGLVLTSVEVGIATKKAIDALNNEPEELTKKEVVKKSAKYYVPALVTGVSSTICIGAGVRQHSKESAGLAAACALAETSMREYKAKVFDVVGEEKAREIEHKVEEDKIKKNPPVQKEIIIVDNAEGELFYEPITGRYLKSTKNDIQKVANDLNAAMISGKNYCTEFNDFCYGIGLSGTDVGSQIGWNVMHGEYGLIEVKFTDHTVSDDGKLCWVISYANEPTYNFDSKY